MNCKTFYRILTLFLKSQNKQKKLSTQWNAKPLEGF